MRLLSLQAAAVEARQTLLRFPAVLACAGVAAVVATILVASGGSHPHLTGLLGSASLGLALFTALTVTAERFGTRAAKWALTLVGLLVLVLFAVAWPGWSGQVQTRRLAQFAVGFHLLVAFLPYLRRNELNGFWQFNRALFLRFLLATLYSQVLYVGLTIALVAIDTLLKIHVDKHAYFYLWIFIIYIFNTWFFLGGVPRDLEALEHRRDYPRGLKVFSQFILIPLVAIYLVILTAYLGRILITGQWPSGWIGYLVSSVAALGILSLLLVHPIRELEENRWVATYARWFYVAMLPAIGMLLVAIGKRVSQYGVTEDRYFIAVLSLWLTAIAVMYIARRHADIRWIPITLSVVAFASAFGPWGAYTVSRQSQIDHLRRLLAGQGLIVNGVAEAAKSEVPFEVRRELSSTLSYLVGTHGNRSVKRLLGSAADLPDTNQMSDRYHTGQGEAMVMLKRLGIEYASGGDGRESYAFWFSTQGEQDMVDLTGLRYHARVSNVLPTSYKAPDSTLWELRLNGRSRTMELRNMSQELHGDVTSRLVFSLDTLITIGRWAGGRQPTGRAPRLEADTPSMHAILIPRSFNGTVTADTIQYLTLDGDLYLAPPLARP